MTLKEEKYQYLIDDNRFFAKRLLDLGLSTKYYGYYFLIVMLDMMINKKVVVKSLTKQVYPEIARIFGLNMCSIERNMRNMINHTWDDRMKSKLKNIWFNNSKPSCRKFIFIVKAYLLIEIS